MMKTRLISIATLLGLALVASIVVLQLKGHNNSSAVSAESFPRNIPTRTPYSTAISGVSALAMQKFANTEILTSVANGIEMSAANFRLENDILKLNVCYQKPSSEEWLIYDAVIQVGAIKIASNGYSGIEETTTMDNGQRQIYTFPNRIIGTSGKTQYLESNGSPDYRCEAINFIIEPDLKISLFNLEINGLMLSRSEGEECTTYRDRVQSILDAKDLGIRVDCVIQDYGSFQSIAEKPASMSQEEAEQLVRDAFREAFTITGPWIFTVTLNY